MLNPRITSVTLIEWEWLLTVRLVYGPANALCQVKGVCVSMRSCQSAMLHRLSHQKCYLIGKGTEVLFQQYLHLCHVHIVFFSFVCSRWGCALITFCNELIKIPFRWALSWLLARQTKWYIRASACFTDVWFKYWKYQLNKFVMFLK